MCTECSRSLANEQLVGSASSLRGELDAANRRIGVLIRESDERLKELERAKETELRYGPPPSTCTTRFVQM